MKKIPVRHVAILLPGLLVSCNVFSPVDPLPPVIPALEIVEVRRNEITVSGKIEKPDFKNNRQEKKSGEIKEYGLVYGTSQNLDVQSSPVVKLGTTATLPLSIQSQKIAGLTANTQYYVAIYARNEGGGMSYSPAVNVKTTDQPAIFANKASVKVTLSGPAPYDLDEGKIVATGDAQTDVTMETFEISGRGTVLGLTPVGGAAFKNMGILDFNNITYLNLLNITDYKAEALSILMNTTTANSVIAYKTGSGRFGKLRIEVLNGKELTISLVAYDK